MRLRFVLLLGIAAVAAGIVFAIWRPWVTQRDCAAADSRLAPQTTTVRRSAAPPRKDGLPRCDGTGTGATAVAVSGHRQHRQPVGRRCRRAAQTAKAACGCGHHCSQRNRPAGVGGPGDAVSRRTRLRIETVLNSQAANKIRKANGEPPYDGLLAHRS